MRTSAEVCQVSNDASFVMTKATVRIILLSLLYFIILVRLSACLHGWYPAVVLCWPVMAIVDKVLSPNIYALPKAPLLPGPVGEVSSTYGEKWLI